jgi:glycerol dehydrogenase-like iron-containing ADH family enzyme
MSKPFYREDSVGIARSLDEAARLRRQDAIRKRNRRLRLAIVGVAIAVGAGLELDVIKIVANRLARIAYDMFGGG